MTHSGRRHIVLFLMAYFKDVCETFLTEEKEQEQESTRQKDYKRSSVIDRLHVACKLWLQYSSL
jgi:hypothetical protein